MERSEVVIHMYVSIDGKIDGEYGSGPSGQYYNDELFRMSNADANGRKTIQMYAAPAKLFLDRYDATGIGYEDWLPDDIQSETWSVSFDRKGVCGWTTNYFDYSGHRMRAIEVVTKQADRRYLAFLRSMGIPYIVGGEKEFNLDEVLVKLKSRFGIDTLAVCGGSRIDGVFLESHLVDRISLVLAPHVNGDPQEKSAFDTAGQFVPDTFAFESAKKLSDGGVHLVFKKVND